MSDVATISDLGAVGAPAGGEIVPAAEAPAPAPAEETAAAAAARNSAGKFTKPRPEHVPEKFWDGEAGSVRTDDLAKSYGEAQKLLGKRWGEMNEEEHKAALGLLEPQVRDKIKADLTADENVISELLKGRLPEVPEEYALAEGLSADDPLLSTARGWLKEAGVTQAGFEKVVAGFQEFSQGHLAKVEQDIDSAFRALGPEYEAVAADMKAEAAEAVGDDKGALLGYLKVRARQLAKHRQALAAEGQALGPDYAERRAAMQQKIKQMAGGDESIAGELLLGINTARGFEAMERLIAATRAENLPDLVAQAGEGAISVEAYRALTRDPNYWSDPAINAKATAMAQKLWPGTTEYGSGVPTTR